MNGTHARLRLPKSREDYAKIFGVSVPTIALWIRRGKNTGNMVPLENPDAFPEWWRKCMSGPVPERLLHLNGAPKDPAPELPGIPPVQRDFSAVKSLDIEGNVEALRVTLAINKQLLDEALIQNEERTVALRQRNYERCFNLLRLAEQSLTELQKARGQLIDREAVVQDQVKIVETLRQMRGRMGRDIMVAIEKRCPRRLRLIFSAIEKLLGPAIEEVRRSEELIFARGLRE